MRVYLAWGIAAALLFAAAGAHAADTCDLPPEREAKVARVLDGQTVRLEGGETVRLVGALAPEAPAFWKGETPWRASERARHALEKLVQGRTVRLASAGREKDRRGRLLAHLFLIDGERSIWVQGRLMDEGNARAYSLPGSRACVRALQAREMRARAGRRGLWGDPFYAIADAGKPEALGPRRFSFQIVEGTVLSVAETRNWTFLNLGPDYRTDFTVAVAARDRKAFKGSDVELKALEGARVRVRGWIERWNGPVIKATHPEQIERVTESESAPSASTQ
jgi:micrococcal nuclease